MYEILTPAEKLIKIRRIIGAKQHHIAGNELTRSLVSQIENGKIKLVPNTAQILANNINKIIKEKNIDYEEVTPEYLLEDKYCQIRKVANKYITDLKILKTEEHSPAFFHEKIFEIESFMSNYNVESILKSKVYKLISDIHFKKLNEPVESSFKLSLSIDFALNANQYETVIELMIESLREHDANELHSEQLRILRLALAIYENNHLEDKDTLKRLYYNIAWCYKKLNKFTESIYYLDLLINSFQFKHYQILDLYVLKANCLLEKRNILPAEQLYHDALYIAFDNDNPAVVSRIYNNLAQLYRYKQDRIKSLEYTNKSLLIKNEISEEDYSNTLYHAIENFIELNEIDLVSNYYPRVLKSLKKVNSKTRYEEILLKIFSYFFENNIDKHLEVILNSLEVDMKTNYIANRELIDLFFIEGDRIKNHDANKSESLINRGIKLIKHLRNL